MPFDEALADAVRTILKKRKGYAEKKMFGGVGFLLNDNLCCGVLRKDLILRLGVEAAEDALREPHVKPFDITGKAMKGWVMLKPDGWQDPDALADWVRQAAQLAGALPRKTPGRR